MPLGKLPTGRFDLQKEYASFDNPPSLSQATNVQMCHRLLCLQRGPRFTAIPNSDNVCSHPSIHHRRDPRVQHLFRFSLPIMSDPKTPWGPLARSYSLLKLDNTSNKGPSTTTSIETVPSAAYLSGSTTALFLPPCLLCQAI